jgi:hypothetical protein
MKEMALPDDDGSLEAQLLDLYRGQRVLLTRLGTSDPEEIVAMVKNLEEQLVAVYAECDTAGSRLPVYGGETGS